MKHLILIILFMFASFSAVAGGSHIKAQKVSFKEGWLGNYVLKMKLIDNGGFKSLFNGCKAITVNGRYNFWKWKVKYRSSKVTYKAHKQAIVQIKKTTADTPISFALIGSALQRMAEVCTYTTDAVVPYGYYHGDSLKGASDDSDVLRLRFIYTPA